MNFTISCFIAGACLTILFIVQITSGELIPGRIQEPRVTRESVHHVRSLIEMNHGVSDFQMQRHHPARYIRSDGVMGAIMKIGMEAASMAIQAWAERQRRKEKAQAAKKVSDTQTSATAEAGRRRRRMEFIAGGREASRAPSGSARQPIRRSAAPRNLPGQGGATRQK